MTALGLVLVTTFAAIEAPVELTPYDVQISIVFEASPAFPAEFRESIGRECNSLIDRTIGERWSIRELTIGSDANAERSVSSRDPAVLPIQRDMPTEEADNGLPSKSAPDKIFIVSVVAAGPDFRVAATEWDRMTDSFGPERIATANERRDIARAVVQLLYAVHRPVAEVRERDELVSLAVKGAAIPTPDALVSPLEKGMLFRPLLRRFDREGHLTEIREIPFTYFEVTSIDQGIAAVDVQSALRSPVGQRRGLVEAWGIAAPASSDMTILRVERRTDSVPLSGRRVEIRNRPFAPGEDEPPPEKTLLTDRSGAVELHKQDNTPLLWLTINSGDVTLMRLPVAPGVEPSIVLPLGDDQGRRDAEGRLAILTGELIETVAKRATLLATARNRARSGRYDEADDALAQASKLPAAAEFRRRIAAIETPAAIEAEKAGDRVVATRIRALGRKANELLDRYLNPDALRAAREEVEELKRTDPDRK